MCRQAEAAIQEQDFLGGPVSSAHTSAFVHRGMDALGRVLWSAVSLLKRSPQLRVRSRRHTREKRAPSSREFEDNLGVTEITKR